jgi:flotillin
MLEEQLILALMAAGAVVVTLLVAGLVAKRCLYIAGPNEILVVSGRRRLMPDGRVVGYRIVVGGRVMRLPFIERVDRMDLTALTVPLEVARAYAKDGVPVDLSATATVKPYRSEDELVGFVERFLGRRRDEIIDVVREPLQGHLRTVAAQWTAAELNVHREKIGSDVQDAAADGLKKIGLHAEALVLHEVAPPPPARVPD